MGCMRTRLGVDITFSSHDANVAPGRYRIFEQNPNKSSKSAQDSAKGAKICWCVRKTNDPGGKDVFTGGGKGRQLQDDGSITEYATFATSNVQNTPMPQSLDTFKTAEVPEQVDTGSTVADDDPLEGYDDEVDLL